jgi:hypothetical protein
MAAAHLHSSTGVGWLGAGAECAKALALLSRALGPPARRYFTARKTLPKQYWTGMARNGSFSLYALPDLSYLSQVASNDPYAHW